MVKSESSKKLFVLDNRLEEIKIELETNKDEKVNLSREIEYITNKYCEISYELETIKKEFENVSSQLQSAEKEISKENESKKELEKKVVSLLIYLNLMGKEELLSIENSYESEMAAVKAKFDQLIGKLDISVLERNELKHELSVTNEKKLQLAEELKNYQITCARFAVEMESHAVSTSEKENAYQENESSVIGGTEAAESPKFKLEESLEYTLKENQKLKDELKQLYFRLQMKCTKENLLASYDKGEMTSDAVFLAEQLDDAKYMIQALEDSKQLVIMEMNDVSKKLTKVTEELCELKCENMLFKVNLEKANSSKSTLDRIKNNIIEIEEKLKKSDMVNKMNDIRLKEKLEKSDLNDKDIESKNQNDLEKSKMDIEKDNEELIREKTDLLLSVLKEKIKYLESKIELENSSMDDKKNDIELKKELEKLREDCCAKDRNIEELKAGMENMHASKISMQDTVNEMIARLKDAEEVYRKLYMEKLRLSKKLKKVMSNNTSYAVSSNVSTTDKSESCYLPINIDVLKESTSASSDSDTGEHVRAMVNTDKGDASDFSEEMPFPTGCRVKTNFGADPVTTTITYDYHPHDKDDFIEVKKLIDKFVSCTICKVNLPPALVSDHYNVIHRMNICPVCDQLFDNSLPPRFLAIHVNEHFND